MQKKVKITIAPLWVGVVNFFQADGISRMQNKMENEMTKQEMIDRVCELMEGHPVKEDYEEALTLIEKVKTIENKNENKKAI